MEGFIISSYDDMSGSYECRRLMEEAGKRDISLGCIGTHDSYAEDGRVYNRGYELPDVDFAINRYRQGDLKDLANGYAERSYNPLGTFVRYADKHLQYNDLKDLAPMPRSILAHASLPFRKISGELGPRFVAKGLKGSRGDEVFLIGSQEDMNNLRSRSGDDTEFLFQETVEESLGRDVRAFCIRGKVVAAMERTNPSDFRSNFAKGAILKKAEPGEEMSDICRKVFGATGLDFAGIDLLCGKEGLVLCEVNVMPGIEGIERVSGTNVAGMLMDMIGGGPRG